MSKKQRDSVFFSIFICFFVDSMGCILQIDTLGRTMQVFCPCHRMPVARVIHIVFMGVCLPFETDVVVCLSHLEPILQEPNQELNPVPQVEERVGHFPLLAGVDEFVVQFVRFHLAPSPLHEDGAEEVESVIRTEGYETIVDDFHGDKVSDFSLETHTEVG